jgi:N-acetylmuramoyl-L-alanine amidase
MLTINQYSRPGYKLHAVRAIILHWVANPMTSAQANRNFFESRKDGKSGYGSAHYIVGLKGEVIQCIPDDEVAYHVGSSQKDPISGKIYTDWSRKTCGKTLPNFCTIGIELCHLDWEGHFAEDTLKAAAKLCADLLKKFNLNTDQIGTHNMIVGWKDCPRLWTRNPDLFESFNELVKAQQEV